MTLPRCPRCDGFVPPSVTTCPNCEPAAARGVDVAQGWLRFGMLLRVTAGSAVAMTLMACYGAPPVRPGDADLDPKAPPPTKLDPKAPPPGKLDPKAGDPKARDPEPASDPKAESKRDDAKGASPAGTPPS